LARQAAEAPNAAKNRPTSETFRAASLPPTLAPVKAIQTQTTTNTAAHSSAYRRLELSNRPTALYIGW
jgi:hypothetical protein